MCICIKHLHHMLTKKYRIKETHLNDKTIFYPEYSYRLFPWYWTRLEYRVWVESEQNNILIYFHELESGKYWLKRYIEEQESMNRIHNL